ncbi:MAG: tRNA (adenosine(37)-N6)-threonylcarbamoyltransferase complex ATPase subunit type 1 TsaE [Nitrospinota bacterium]|nr:tRNA (adenosine(37)-N6)-threonylcarbamoyltransferase complex ATPase subunit type 1 TsaE [Nitrospinota bacterium]
MNVQFQTQSPNDTLILGKKIGQHLETGDIVFLFGDLGAGKTTLTQGIAQGLGVSKDEYVRSPTFTLVNQYKGKVPVFHIDLYRIGSPRELEDLGLEEVFASEGVSVVEWAEKLFAREDASMPLLGIEQWIEIHITIEEEESRKFDLKTHNIGSPEHPVFALH